MILNIGISFSDISRRKPKRMKRFLPYFHYNSSVPRKKEEAANTLLVSPLPTWNVLSYSILLCFVINASVFLRFRHRFYLPVLARASSYGSSICFFRSRQAASLGDRTHCDAHAEHDLFLLSMILFLLLIISTELSESLQGGFACGSVFGFSWDHFIDFI